jgi:FMN phosphatase YigB (HAD superfamily)
VFDTVITRAVGNPASLFLLLGRVLADKGLIDCSAEAFYHARRAASRRAGARLECAKTIHDIYEELRFSLGISERHAARLKAEELALEATLIRRIPGARERLREARTLGMKVCFLSDMYLDSPFIRSLLEQHELHEPGDGCLVSCEIGCEKGDGRAFLKLARHESIPVERIVHRGNDLRKDVQGARRAGVVPEPSLEANLNRYENLLEGHVFQTEGLSSALAGASRLARLSVEARTPRERALRDVAAGVAGPTLVAYVLWILKRAERMRLRRLYFAARDGYILKRIAERLVVKLGLDVELRYLHGGRKAWYAASVTEVAPSELFWAVDDLSRPNSLEKVLSRLRLEPDEIRDTLREIGVPPGEHALDRTDGDLNALWRVLQHPVATRRILERAATLREGVLAYLEQEGLFDGTPWGLVDVGWTGRVLNAFNSILSTRGSECRNVFFFGRSAMGYGLSRQQPLEIHSYIGDQVHQLGYPKYAHPLFVELFCGAEHGATVGYRLDVDGVKPLLEVSTNEPLAEWGLSTVHDTILAFTDHLWLDPVAVNHASDLRPAIAELLSLFFESPSRSEAEAWGSYPIEYGRTGVVTARIAAPLTWWQLPQALRHGAMKTRKGTEWIEGGLALTPPLLRGPLEWTLASRRLALRGFRRFGKPK